MWWIRFIKTPPQTIKPAQEFRFIFTIVTDLGDTYYCYDAKVSFQALDPFDSPLPGFRFVGSSTYNPANPFCQMDVIVPARLPPNLSSIKLMLKAKSETRSSETLVTMSKLSKDIAANELSNFITAPNITTDLLVPLYSAPITIEQKKPSGTRQTFCERIFALDGRQKRMLRITEECSNSLARHVWDCGVALALFLSFNTEPYLSAGRNVIELGAGTGMAGIAASILATENHIAPPPRIYLTDLQEALDVIERNVRDNRCKKVTILELEWGNHHPKPEKLGPDFVADTILLADILYNNDTHDILLESVLNLSNVNTDILLAYKRRHDSEDGFWQKLEDLDISKTELSIVAGMHIYLLKRKPNR